MTLGKIAIAFTIMLAFSVSFSSTKEILSQPTTNQVRSNRLGATTEYIIYNNIKTEGGEECRLHMKVYISEGKIHHPLMVLHGGGWHSGWYTDETDHLVSYEYLKRFLKVGDGTNTSYLIAEGYMWSWHIYTYQYSITGNKTTYGENWPTGTAKHYDTNAKYILAVYRYLMWTDDFRILFETDLDTAPISKSV